MIEAFTECPSVKKKTFGLRTARVNPKYNTTVSPCEAYVDDPIRCDRMLAVRSLPLLEGDAGNFRG